VQVVAKRHLVGSSRATACSGKVLLRDRLSSLLEFHESLPLTQFDQLHEFARGFFPLSALLICVEKHSPK
jgi:hypothetical protein